MNHKKIQPKWGTCFDCHLYNGRNIQIIIKNLNGDTQIADTTVSADILANKAKDKLTLIDWVSKIFFIFKTKQFLTK